MHIKIWGALEHNETHIFLAEKPEIKIQFLKERQAIKIWLDCLQHSDFCRKSITICHSDNNVKSVNRMVATINNDIKVKSIVKKTLLAIALCQALC